MKTRTAKLATVALIFNEDKTKILGVSRKDDQTIFGLPGGKVDEGEGLLEALIRELKEETGLDLIESRPIFFREDSDFVAVVYLVTKYEGTINTLESGVVEWITFDRLKKGAFSEYNTALEEHLIYIKII
jgi:8-oxo-dGTP diphosphatase